MTHRAQLIAGRSAARFAPSALLGAMVALLSACGGGGSSSPSSPTPPAGGGGSGPAAGSAQCAAWAMPAGTTVRTTYASPATPSLAATQSVSNNGTVSFAGQSATEIATTGTLGAAAIDIKVYGAFDATSGVATLYGSVTHYVSATTLQDTTSILTPPIVDTEFALAAGQSVASQMEVSSDTTTVTVNGVAGQPTTTTRSSASPATTFVGIETVTVAAGTFTTCRYLASTGITSWILAGYGTEVQNSQGGFATSILVNGVALTHN